MLDTVILAVPRGSAMDLPLDGPDIPKWELHTKKKSFEKRVINETAKMKRDSVYRPRIREVIRGGIRTLYIEFSVPKLINGNNVDEVSEQDFPIVINTLRDRIKDFGLGIFSKTLMEAKVMSFHPSKNILLSDGYRAQGVIKELSKINLTKKLDLTRVKFTNDGESLQCYAISHSLVLYDKLADLKKPKKKAVDQDQTSYQQSLFDFLKEKKSFRQIFRIEVRLSKKVKMNAILHQVGIEPNPTFEEVFKKNVCQKIVQSYWQTITSNENLFLFDMNYRPQKVLQRILATYPDMKARQAIRMVGLYLLAKDDGGIQQLRGIIEPVTQRRGWYRIKDDFKQLSAIQGLMVHSWVRQINGQIKDFEPVRLPT